MEKTKPDAFLSAGLRDELDHIGPVDIVVGVPSFNNAKTIGHVVHAVSAGLSKYFPTRKAILVNSDGGSKDGTAEAVHSAQVADYRALLAEHPLQTVHRLITPYHGIPGKGSALRTVFAVADALQAKACAVVDSDLRSITPHWVELLVGPILSEGIDFVAPLYHRHKYDGTITNSIVYPLFRALYGKRVRQPIGGEFGFSGKLARYYLSQDVWHTDVARFGIDIWMTTSAVTGGFSVCQAFLGAKIHDVKDPGVDLSNMLTQVVRSVFDLMEINHAVWAVRQGSEEVPLFGLRYAVGLEPIRVNVERMVRTFRVGFRELSGVWERVLSKESFQELRRLAERESEPHRLPAELWVMVIYDFALAHHRHTIHRDHLMRSLTPLYLGRTASFVLETEEADAEEVEARIEELCRLFESGKPYLVEQWGN